ncbi:ABC transporter permease [Gordonia soli]|uniref:ABC transporter permease protein n=1 Tax=Gordonia soli NBRC 108243 TaxID=1223545 RepID=M0QF44_9ACTN|nr:ABC transporter permease [Gordonia soli]GAC66911.1 hypothetical protein GS4_05_01200 [Gordonia soli NBRC 108243]
MRILHAEFLKLRRSLAWTVAVVLPIVMVGTATVNTIAADASPDGWHTLWLRSTVFYGLFPLAVGVAIIAALVWRPEHLGGNRNALMAAPTRTWQIVVVKTSVIAVLAVAMQVVLVVAVILAGKLVIDVSGALPLRYSMIGATIAVATIPVAAVQSLASMVLRSFGGSIAVALVGAGTSALILLAVGDLAMISPYGLAARATQLGTGTFADHGPVTPTIVVAIILIAFAVTALVVGVASATLDRSDVRT